MRKNWIAIFLMIAFIFSTMTVIANEDSSEQQMVEKKIEVLSALGICDVEPEKIEQGITKGEFVKAVAHMILDGPLDSETVFAVAVENGMILKGEENKFDFQAILEFEEMLPIVLSALGYGEVIRESGGRNAMRVASKVGILSGVEFDETIVNWNCAVKVLYNMIQADFMKMTGVSQNYKEHKIQKGETILSCYRKIYYRVGRVDMTGDTGLMGETVIRKNEVRIGGEIYQCGKTQAPEMLGMTVEIYVKEESDDRPSTLLYVGEKGGENNVLDLSHEAIVSVSEDCRTITYEQDYGKVKTVRLSPAVKMIYNGRFEGDYTWRDFLPESGNVRLIKCKGREYDVAVITSYQTVIVDYISMLNHTIYNKYTHEKALSFLTLDESEGDYEFRLVRNGQKIQLKELKEWDVLSVAVSKSGKPYLLKAVADGSAISGKMEKRELNNKIRVSGVEYKLSKAFVMAQENQDAAAICPKLGEECTIYIDMFGEVAAVYYDELSEAQCVFLKQIRYDALTGSCYVKFMDLNEVWQIAELSSKVLYNQTQMKAGEVYEKLVPAGVFEEQVIRVRMNRKGVVRELETAQETAEYKKGVFTRMKILGKVYRESNRSFQSEIYLSDTARIFLMPENGREEEFSVRKSDYLKGDKSYGEIMVYNLDEYQHTDLLVMKQTESDISNAAQKNGFFMVDQVCTEVGADGVPIKKLYGVMGKYRSLSVTAKNDTLFDGLKKGDLVFLNVNSSGMVDYLLKAYSVDDEEKKLNANELHTDTVILAGEVLKIDTVGGKVCIDCGIRRYLRMNPSQQVMVYTYGREIIEHGKMLDIEEGDYVVMRISFFIDTGCCCISQQIGGA